MAAVLVDDDELEPPCGNTVRHRLQLTGIPGGLRVRTVLLHLGHFTSTGGIQLMEKHSSVARLSMYDDACP